MHVQLFDNFTIENGANVNAKNKWGNTPLVTADCLKKESVVKYLLEHEAEG